MAESTKRLVKGADGKYYRTDRQATPPEGAAPATIDATVQSDAASLAAASGEERVRTKVVTHKKATQDAPVPDAPAPGAPTPGGIKTLPPERTAPVKPAAVTPATSTPAAVTPAVAPTDTTPKGGE